MFCQQDQNKTAPERMPGETPVAREEPAVEKDQPETLKSGVGPPRGLPAPSPEPSGEENICETGLQVGPPPTGEGGSRPGTVSRKISFSPTITEITPTGRSTKKQDLQALVAAKKRTPERSLPGSSDPPRNKTRVGPLDTQGEKGKSSSSGTAMVVQEQSLWGSGFG